MSNLQECNLCAERSYCRAPVSGCGDMNAEVCWLGRNPGYDEDQLGRPFVGNAGGKLNEGLNLTGLTRAKCWIDNISKCMTPKDVVPTQQCRKTCSSVWLLPTLCELKRLRLVVALGNEALHYFLNQSMVSELHGTIFPVPHAKVGQEGVAVFISYHPSAALRSTMMNNHFKSDMQRLKHYLMRQHLVTT
ncbi:hypothetical protein LCGC14_0612900 [marine sediment metagenome]|uniref:Uracil-DNA glycosylase-like domain-containing protein n=1 Tax=marine sediment metagenome TaxID=412755 RepID=A0A0F9UFK4_9ZZZZ